MDEKKKTYDVIGLGEILWDLLPEGKQLSSAMEELAAKADAYVSAIWHSDLKFQEKPWR